MILIINLCSEKLHYLEFVKPIEDILGKDYIDNLEKKLPELPHAKFNRFVNDLKLSEYNASILVNEKKLAAFFEEGLKHTKNTSSLCNWITVEFQGRLKQINKDITSFGIEPKNIAALVNMIENKKITGKIAKLVADDMIKNPAFLCEDIIKSNPNYQPLSDLSVIEPIVDEVIKNNPDSIEAYKNGKIKAFAFLVGQVMKLTKGKSSPEIVNKLLHKKLD